MSLTIDVHVLHAYPLSNLNRDEFGSPKIALLGGVERTRISSACQKRGCRINTESVLGDRALRTRRIPEKVAAELRTRGWDEQDALNAGQAIALTAQFSGMKLAEAGTTNVMLFIPESAINDLADLADTHRDLLDTAAEQARAHADAADKTKTETKTKAPTLDKDTKAQVTHLKNQVRDVLCRRNGSIAAFGRMLANTPEATVDGAIAVAHATTTHAGEEQPDFFTAVDDIPGTDNGSAHMGQHAHASGTFYRYATISVDELVRNLDGDRAMARELIHAFLTEFARHVPTAKKNSTAPFTPPALVHLAVRTDQPMNLGGAFEAPITADDTSGWTAPSITALDQHAAAVNTFLGDEPLRAAAHSGTADLTGITALGTHIPRLDTLVTTITDAALAPAGHQ
ncbi:type I-E CRISPR-associated protein Cas7/Cse4/CasC [Streptomyces sp. H10-C2]|uniref:type I-E CRISPR-associated protein Cas7/Cse4/CasC n=1 Tax=unclassified Streptomyces TaxID=2593676 RepID=UPI0024BA29E4|nr:MULTISPECIES: type I-E CRISPR-associated protein Cas7/Cse4/CasC [unclassified Streptomyces]MDJ0347657.1 type I-E CRISPR-associated protein Cas7/Cse4/CasC [Streptomyces sp. PH10-H1]MDJ0372529.1 type I-E CRISPR-associated protein Cas7/Cse4/CasC [Streptomyces sp. H10-C2]